MKRVYISLALLGLICLCGIWNSANLKGLTDELGTLLKQAESAAVAGDWDKSSDLTQQAIGLWEDRQIYVYVTVHHDEIEAVETSFEEIKGFIRWQETPEYIAANSALLAQVEHVWAAERFCWENLF